MRTILASDITEAVSNLFKQANYNLGEDVPFQETLDRTGKYHHTRISIVSRGELRAVYELLYNHYVKRARLDAPYTQKAAEKIRPEGPGLPSADHPGFGTLLFSRDAGVLQISSPEPPASPGGIIGNIFYIQTFSPFATPST